MRAARILFVIVKAMLFISPVHAWSLIDAAPSTDTVRVARVHHYHHRSHARSVERHPVVKPLERQKPIAFPYVSATFILDEYTGRRPVTSMCANPTVDWYHLKWSDFFGKPNHGW